LGILLTWGIKPEINSTLNYRPVGALAVAVPFIYGMVRRKLAVCIASASLGVMIAAGFGLFDALGTGRSTVPLTTALGTWGAAMLFIAWRCKEKAEPIVRVLGAIALMINTFDGFPDGPSVTWSLVCFAAVTLAACVAVWLCFRDPLPVIFLGMPVLIRVWTLTNRCAAWRYVVISFVLLFAGAVFSVRKAHGRGRAGDGTETG